MAHTDVTGQATVVDLGNGRLLLGLLSGRGPVPALYRDEPQWGEGATGLLQEAYGLAVGWPVQGTPNYPQLAQQRGVRPLALEKLPSLVTFRNTQDPRTVIAVDPRNLENTFGPGVKLEQVTIEITDGPITTGITSTLPWLKGRRNYIDGESTNAGTSYLGDQFVRGVR